MPPTERVLNTLHGTLITYLCTSYSSLQLFAGPAEEEIENKITDRVSEKKVQFTNSFVKRERENERCVNHCNSPTVISLTGNAFNDRWIVLTFFF